MKFQEFAVRREQTEHMQLVRCVYGCLFVFDRHLQMAFASSEALMAIVHQAACVSHRGCDRRSPTQVNDQSLQRK